MWQKFKEQIPAVILTALLVLAGAFWVHQQTVSEMAAKQQAEIAPLREQNEALKTASEENRRQIEATNKLLKDAISKREADMFRTDEEIQKLNVERMDALAEAIAKKVQPYNPLPKTPEEAERMQNEQVDKVSSRMADKISPILAEMAKDQHLTRDSIAQYSQRISDQVGNVLTNELAKNQQLNNNLQATQAVADDAMKLSHEITALYLSTFKDQGLITRLLTLPANVVKDAASFSIVNSSDRKKIEEQLVSRMNDIDKRLSDIQAQAPKK
jgi:type II secretory pathway component PulM